ncbi:MAG: hypothetical protein PHR13_11350, partial [Dysgonamonadaceae bacterium]|nr:hypothetical protein [Dysgonamonadaceae bacterium]MDD4400066.1 hypothetical protein [Dysgonamonadaceae bacterium]
MGEDKFIVITRPNYNRSTRYFYYWAKNPIEIAKEKGMKIIDLKVERATEKELKRSMKFNPCMIVFNGCEDLKKLLGFNSEVLIDKCQSLFSNKTARIILVRDFKKNKFAYIGHVKPFTFIHSSSIYNPLDDNIAHLFLDPLENLVIDIVKGKTVGEAFQRCKDLLQENIKKCPSLGYDFAIPYLTSNYESLVLFGS